MVLKKRENSEFKFDGGVIEYVEFLDQKREKLQKNGMIYSKKQFISKIKNNIEIECALKWNAGYSEDVFLIQIIFIKKMVVLMF